jgi:hypothetical protein
MAHRPTWEEQLRTLRARLVEAERHVAALERSDVSWTTLQRARQTAADIRIEEAAVAVMVEDKMMAQRSGAGRRGRMDRSPGA